MYPHAIRLRGPWQVEPLDGTPTFSIDGRRSQMTVPGFWRDFGLPDYWGRALLRRGFHWTAKLEPDEVVWLNIDQCVGRGAVRLNGVEIGRIDSPWVEYRVDTTPHLQKSNLLEIELDATDPQSSRWGTLGMGDGGGRASIGGVIGGVHLSIESKLLVLDWLCANATWNDGGGTLQMEAGMSARQFAETTSDVRFVPRMAISVDGEIVHESEWEPTADGRFAARLDGLAVQPWQTRRLGSPKRTPIQFEGRVGGINCIDRSLQIGFVDRRSMDLQVGAPLSVKTLLPERSLLPFAGEDSTKPFEQWSFGGYYRVRFAGHVPPESLLRLLDRAGMPVEIEIPDLPPGLAFDRASLPTSGKLPAEVSREILSLIARLRSHACVTRIGDWQADSQGAESKS